MEDDITTLDYTQPDFETQYGKIINWIHYEVDRSTLVRELVEYTNRVNMPEIADCIHQENIGITGSIAYCLNRGARLRPSSIEKLDTWLQKIKHEKIKEPEIVWEILDTTTTGKNIQAYVNAYSLIDNAKSRVLSGKLDIRELPIEIRKILTDKTQNKSAVAKLLLEHYKDALVESRNCQVISDWQRPLSVIVDTISIMVNNRAGIRRGSKSARAHKMATTVETADRKGERAAAKVNYKDADQDLGIDSVLPTNLIGADAAVIYNTKTRHCEVYFADADKKLSVTGAKITNFNPEKSQGKTLRKPEQDLPHWNRATSIRRLEVLLKQFKGKNWDLSGKLNKNTMILSVIFS